MRKGIDNDVTLESVLKGRNPDVWVIINGIPIFLAVNEIRLLEVRGNKNGDRSLRIEKLLETSSNKPILCMVNGGSFAPQKYPWAAFEIVGFEAVGNDGSETHIGPYDMRAIGLGATFCAHFKGPQCVYKLGRLLGTNIKKKEWQPALPTPKQMYWKELRKEGRIPKDSSVTAFKKSTKFSQEELQNFVDTVTAEREGKCEKCSRVRKAELKTY